MTHLNHGLSQLAHNVSRDRSDRGHSGRWFPQGDVRDRRTEFHDGEMIVDKKARENWANLQQEKSVPERIDIAGCYT